MTPAQIIHLGLSKCYLCASLECRTVSNCSDQCPICGSHVIGLAGIVDREKEQAEP